MPTFFGSTTGSDGEIQGCQNFNSYLHIAKNFDQLGMVDQVGLAKDRRGLDISPERYTDAMDAETNSSIEMGPKIYPRIEITQSEHSGMDLGLTNTSIGEGSKSKVTNFEGERPRQTNPELLVQNLVSNLGNINRARMLTPVKEQTESNFSQTQSKQKSKVATDSKYEVLTFTNPSDAQDQGLYESKKKLSVVCIGSP